MLWIFLMIVRKKYKLKTLIGHLPFKVFYDLNSFIDNFCSKMYRFNSIQN